MKTRVLCAVVALLFVAIQASAQATPNHVFQKTERIRAILESLNQANYSNDESTMPPPEPAMPRHVLQVTREIWRKTQLLRFMNGLPTSALDPVPVQEITPTQVVIVVDQLLVQLVELKPAYGLMGEIAEVSLPTDKTPGDVLANLLRLSDLLDSLGVPTTVPNDVYQVASSVLLNGIALAESLGISDAQATVNSVPEVTGKSPKDVYDEALAMFADLDRLTKTQSVLAPKGGIFVPDPQAEKVTPGDVLLKIARAGADINAMRAKSQTEGTSFQAPYLGGKTPSDVMHRVLQVRAVVDLISQIRQS
ncbi:MAG: hypothetical protein ABJQ70_15925 [Roseobacter sp.]